MIRRNRSFTSLSSTTLRLGPCKAVMVPVPADPADVMQAFQHASQSVAQELVIESTLHIPATQRFECFQKYPGAVEISFTADAAPALADSQQDSAISAVVAEAAACYAAPSEAPADVEHPHVSRAVQQAVPGSRIVTCRGAYTAQTAECEAGYQRAAAAVELYTTEVTKAAHAARQRKRRALRQARLKALRSSKQLLHKVPKLETVGVALFVVVKASYDSVDSLAGLASMYKQGW